MSKRFPWVLLLGTGLFLASCGDSRSSRRRSRRDRDDDGRPAERQPAERTAQRGAEAEGGQGSARTAQREAETVPPADRAPDNQRAIVADEVGGAWTFHSDVQALVLKMQGDREWTLTYKYAVFGMEDELEARGTYKISGSRIQFTTTAPTDGLANPQYATMPAASKMTLSIKLGDELETYTLKRAAQGDDGGARQAERREEPEEDRLDPRALVGVWTTNAPVGQVTLILQADGNFALEMTSPYAVVPARHYGRYTVAGNRLTLKYGGGMMPDDTSIVHMPNPNLLIAKGLTGVTQEYRRVQQTPAGGR